jgi:hypothetical protein
VDSIISLCSNIFSRGSQVVVIYEILHRAGDHVYNAKADTTNQLLKSYCEDKPSLIFWTHKRNNFNRRFIRDYVANDGVHVDNQKGMPRYYASVRGSILLAEKCLSQ